MGRVSGEAVLGLVQEDDDVAADCRNTAKLRTASCRPSGALDESAELIMLCSGTETAQAGRPLQSLHVSRATLGSSDKASSSPLVCLGVEGWQETPFDFR